MTVPLSILDAGFVDEALFKRRELLVDIADGLDSMDERLARAMPREAMMRMRMLALAALVVIKLAFMQLS